MNACEPLYRPPAMLRAGMASDAFGRKGPMNWKDLLAAEIEYNYAATEKLMDMADDDSLSWKPATGDNWMTTGQLLLHLTNACGMAFKGFATGDWGLPEGVDMADMPAEDMMPPAEKMSAATSVAEAKRLLAEDKKTALDILADCTEKRLAEEPAPVPWDPGDNVMLGHRLLQMVYHLNQHKGQLFYYLKLQGKPMHTGHLWG